MEDYNNQFQPQQGQNDQSYPQQSADYQQQPQTAPPQNFQAAVSQNRAPESRYGPRKMSFFTLVLKTFAGLGGGLAGSLILLLIFLLSSSILQPILGATAESETAAGEVSSLFMVILLAMVFSTSIISSMVGTLFLCYTERDRYNRIATTMSQVFIINLVIFAFVLPIYLTTSTASLELTAFAAALQIILSATASAMILELIHDRRYALISVYSTILAMLVGSGINFFLFYTMKNATMLLFVAVPIIWTLIGFSQAVVQMLYYWIFQTWGSDFLASNASFGTDYGIPDESEEEEEAERAAAHPDVEGANFLKQ
jgi:MFS family permease